MREILCVARYAACDESPRTHEGGLVMRLVSVALAIRYARTDARLPAPQRTARTSRTFRTSRRSARTRSPRSPTAPRSSTGPTSRQRSPPTPPVDDASAYDADDVEPMVDVEVTDSESRRAGAVCRAAQVGPAPARVRCVPRRRRVGRPDHADDRPRVGVGRHARDAMAT